MERIVNCERCKAPCKTSELRSSNAKMLRHSKEPKGLCVNCAVHDWLRNTYPPNIILAGSGPKILLYPHIQKQFAEIMRFGSADAKPDEIDWNRIVDNWDLPFPNKIKPSCANPCSQRELDEITAGKRQGFLSMIPPKPDPHGLLAQASSGGKLTITSFEELNQLKPGCGDELKKCLRKLK